MAPLSPVHRRYVLVETAISVFANIMISIPLALLASHGVAMMTMGGPRGMAADLVLTVFMATLATTLVVTALTRKRVGGGRVDALADGDGGWLARAPRRLLLRALTCAFVCVLALVPLTIAAMAGLRLTSMSAATFIGFKASYSALLAILITPFIVRAALCSPPTSRAAVS